jgi:predicted transcriptional regulator
MHMSRIEALRKEIHTAVDTETSEETLTVLQEILAKKYPLVPEAWEAGIAKGLEDIKAGRTLSLEEFKLQSEQEAIVRRQKYQ